MALLRTNLTRVLNCRLPFVGAPMSGPAGGALAAAVSKAGGFGFIGTGAVSREFIDQELAIARNFLGARDGEKLNIGVGFLAWRLDATPEPAVDIIKLVAPQVECIWLSFGSNLKKWFDVARSASDSVKIAVVASTPAEVLKAVSWGAQIVVVQGVEAGGHGLASGSPLLSFLPIALDTLPSDNRPAILAAGGISTGAQAVAALALGADGFVVGTRLLATPESLNAQPLKKAIVDAEFDSTVRTMVYDTVRGATGWPTGIDGRAIRNKTYDEHIAGRDIDELKADYATGDVSRAGIWSGTSVGSVKSVIPAEEVVREFERDIVARIKHLNQILNV